MFSTAKAAAAAGVAAFARRAAARTGTVVAVTPVGLLCSVQLTSAADADPGERGMLVALVLGAVVAFGVASAALVGATLLVFRFGVPLPPLPLSLPPPHGTERGMRAPRCGREHSR